jgi:curved DNA-binding protein CbpA
LLLRREFLGVTDYFAVLGQERRPWLDEGKLKSRYLELTRANHPDIASGGDFELVNEAYQILREPRRRLLHLLALTGTPPPAATGIAPELGQLFSSINQAEESFRGLSERSAAASSPLVRALLVKERLALRERCEDLNRQLQEYERRLRTELQQTDLIWDRERETAITTASALGSQFAFIARWRSRIRERLVELSHE